MSVEDFGIVPTPPNATNQALIQAQATVDEYVAHRRNQDLEWVLSDPRGRGFIDSLLDMCGVYRSSVDQNPHMVYLNEGTRNAGLQILGRLTQLRDDAYLLIQQERIRRQQEARAMVEAKANSLASQTAQSLSE